MKNTILIASAVCILSVGTIFTSCSKEDVKEAGNKVLLTSGKWQLLSATTTVSGGAGVTIPNAPKIISFTTSNHYRIYDNQGSVTHDVKYSFDDKNTISFDNITYDLTTINQSNLTLVSKNADNITVNTYLYKRKL